jgi:hypothetical protein
MATDFSSARAAMMTSISVLPAMAAAFLGSLVEAVEALTIVLAVATVRGWRPAGLGALGGLVSLALIVFALGPLLDRVPAHALQFGIGVILLLFGMRWLRKAILRAASRLRSSPWSRWRRASRLWHRNVRPSPERCCWAAASPRYSAASWRQGANDHERHRHEDATIEQWPQDRSSLNSFDDYLRQDRWRHPPKLRQTVQEVSMRRLFVLAVAMLFSGSASLAQTAMGTPSIGATSPLGIPGSTSSASPTGIPLGATEIDPGGLSPAPIGSMAGGSNCIAAGILSSGMATSAASASSTAGTSATPGTASTFDGGGTTGMGTVTSGNCASTSSGMLSSTGTASPLSNPGANTSSALSGGTLPLGSTEIGSAGVSPMINVPGPTITTTPCAGIGVTPSPGLTGSTASSTGMLPPSGAAGTTVGSSFGC